MAASGPSLILVDTSAWIERLRKTGSPANLRLTRALESGEPLATTGAVLMEVLAGARDDDHADYLLRLLARCRHLAADEPTDAVVAADLYRVCRKRGQAVRSVVDCLIAAVAIRTGARVLHCDRDFETLARHTRLRTVGLSPGSAA